jgi:membrane-associated phospholipid phosphatase
LIEVARVDEAFKEKIMNALMGLMLTVTVSLMLSTILVKVLSHPLQSILAQLCPSTDASRFWVAFTAVMLYIAPLLFAMFFSSFEPVQDVAALVRSTLVTTLVGASAALIVVGYNIANARPRVKSEQA